MQNYPYQNPQNQNYYPNQNYGQYQDFGNYQNDNGQFVVFPTSLPNTQENFMNVHKQQPPEYNNNYGATQNHNQEPRSDDDTKVIFEDSGLNGIPNVPPNNIPNDPPNGIPSVPPNSIPDVPPNGIPNVPPNAIPNEPPNTIPDVPPSDIPNEPPNNIPNVPPQDIPNVPPNGIPDTPPTTFAPQPELMILTPVPDTERRSNYNFGPAGFFRNVFLFLPGLLMCYVCH